MIRRDLKDFILTVSKDITLIAATKYIDIDDMEILLENGINNFGENRVDSFLRKYELLKNRNITWHFIGHLQRNKANEVINKIDFLHSLNSLELAKIIDKRRSTPLKCFVEVSVNLEDAKNGIPYFEIENFISKILNLKNIKIVGLMMMAKKGSTSESLRNQFHKLSTLKKEIEAKFSMKIPYLSMGMSDDYKEALLEGATHIRLGRVLLYK